MNHVPVLLKEVIAGIGPTPGGKYIDATVGDGGHTEALLQASQPNGRVLGIDRDERQLAVARIRLQPFVDRVDLVCGSFSHLTTLAQAAGYVLVDGILFDLGISSRQLENPAYGLGFADAMPLDMRLDAALPYTAADLLNHAKEREIADVLFRYGDRHNSFALASKLVAYRRKTPFATAEDVKAALRLTQPGSLAPIFQALRIWVNNEYAELEAALPQAVELLAPGGRLGVISFHSGEDRLVKRFLHEHRDVLDSIKPFKTPSSEEITINLRARSAKLRVAQKKGSRNKEA